MFDLTVDDSKSFELLPEDKWILARVVRRDVVRWLETERKYANSNDEVLRKLFVSLTKAEVGGDELRIRDLLQELKGYQFSFVFKPLEGVKYTGYFVRGRTGTRISFYKTDGSYEPNKLAKFYLGAGGKEAKRGERLNIDAILGNYVAVKLQHDKNQTTKKVYQQVVDVREVTNDELVQAKSVELEIKEIESKLVEEKKKLLEKTLGEDGVTQRPILEGVEHEDNEEAF